MNLFEKVAGTVAERLTTTHEFQERFSLEENQRLKDFADYIRNPDNLRDLSTNLIQFGQVKQNGKPIEDKMALRTQGASFTVDAVLFPSSHQIEVEVDMKVDEYEASNGYLQLLSLKSQKIKPLKDEDGKNFFHGLPLNVLLDHFGFKVAWEEMDYDNDSALLFVSLKCPPLISGVILYHYNFPSQLKVAKNQLLDGFEKVYPEGS